MIFALKILVVLLLVSLNGFFVASEFAIVKIRETRLLELARSGNLRAAVARSVVRKLDAYLSATQLGITLASLGLGWLGEPLVAEQLEPALRYLGVENQAWISGISVSVGFFIITALHIVLGELAPKSLAISRAESTALWVAIPLRAFYWTGFPLIWFLNAAAIGVLRLFGVRPATEDELAHSQAELLMILTQSARGGLITEPVRRISERALRFSKLQARMIMVPRNEIVFMSLADPLSSNLAKARSNNYARYPLVEGNLDEVVGMAHIRDVLWMLQEGKDGDPRKVARELVLVPEDENLENLLQKFLDSHTHMALVLDETGSVSGLVTLEDVLEQLVGQIQDEFDRESPLLKKIGDNLYEVSGRTPLALLHLRFGLEFNEDEVVTVSGYFTDRLGRFPLPGDELKARRWKMTVTATDGLKVKTARLERALEVPFD